MRVIKQGTVKNITVLMIDVSDHITGKTGLTLSITLSKNGDSFGTITPTVTELNYGWYKIILTASHTDTLGDLTLHITGSGADPTDVTMQVVAYEPEEGTALGLTNIDVEISTRAAPGDEMNLETGAITSDQIDTGAITETAFAAGAITATVAPNLDEAISTRAPESGGNLADVKAKTDNLPATPAAQGDIMALDSTYDAAKVAASATAVGTLQSDMTTLISTDVPALQSVVDEIHGTDVPSILSDTIIIKGKTNLIGASVALETGGYLDAVKAKTDGLPTFPAAVGDEMSLPSAYDRAKNAASYTELAVVGGDVIIIKSGVSSLQSDVTAIKAKTDNLPANPAGVGDAMTLTAAYDAAKVAGDKTTLDAIDALVTFIKTALFNKRRWDAVNSRWQIYNDAGDTVLYNLKVYNPSDDKVILGSNAIAHGDKVA